MKKKFNIKNQPKKIVFCSKCVLSNQKPVPSLIKSDDPGHTNREFLRIEKKKNICSACLAVERKFDDVEDKIDWREREAKFRKLLKKYKSRNGSYDCIVPGSGGKDSVYQAEILKKKYGMNPLTITFSPQLYTEIGMKNFHNWMEVGGVNNLLFTPSGKVYGSLVRLAYERMLHPFQPFIFGQRHFATHLAKLFKISLIFFGETHSEFGSRAIEEDSHLMSYDLYTREKNEKIFLSGCTINELYKKYKFNPSDLNYFLPLEKNDLIKNDIKIIFLGYFENLSPQENFYRASKISDFKTNNERSEGTYSKYISLDDKTDGFHFWTTYVKYGLGRASDEAAWETRHKYINREEAINLVKKYDGEFPKKYFKEFLKFTNLNEERFFEIADSFRQDHLWKKTGNDFRYAANWKLKQTIY